MPSSPEDRLRVAAVISALKAAGIRVKNWKNFLNGEATHGDTHKQERRCNIFAFGRDLALLPQCHLPEMGGSVPRFLVDACEFLSQHLHTEGLFRKTGSLSRIRALRVELEQGEPVLSAPLSPSLQACDVASLLKQFLRELPSPLIPLELQGALCRAQGLGPDGGRDGGPGGGRDGATLLVTALFPPSHARALRYLCTFLRSAAQRCSENRMEVSSLALLMAPNLLQGLAAGCKLTVGTERLLDRQAAVITAFITHAERIGVIPSFIMEVLSGSAPPLAEGVGFQERAGLSVYRSLRRQRRRSVGEMFVDAFSKLKTGRTPTGPSQPSDSAQGQQGAAAAVLQSPGTTKRKASEDTLPEVEGSAKKRRSIHDLREDTQPTSLSYSDDSESQLSQSPTPSLCSVMSSLEASDEHCLLGPQTPSTKKRNRRKNTKRVQRVPAPEHRAQRRRRSLRFFTASSWSSSSTLPSDGVEADNWLLGTKQLNDNPGKPSSNERGGPFQMPVILIDGPGGVVVGSEVEDDPDTLNCSFVESPRKTAVSSRRVWSAAQPEGGAGNGAGDGRAQGGGAEAEVGEGSKGPAASREAGAQPEWEGCVGHGERCDPVVDVFRRVSRGYRPPRRSISLPEVTSEQVGGAALEAEEEEEEEGEEDRVGEFGGSDFRKYAWPREDPIKGGNGRAWDGVVSESVRGRGGEAEQVQQNGRDKRKEAEREKKGRKEEKKRAEREGEGKGEEAGLGFVRSSQRMSVADRMRRFNLLSAWLRAPRPPPVPPAPQRGPVRLRRQGARRFSRSVSHEGVAGLLQEQCTDEPPQSLELQQQGEQDPYLSPVNPLKPVIHLNCGGLANPHNPLNHVNHHNPGDPVKPHNPLNPVNHHNPGDPVKPHNPLNPVNHHNPEDPVKPHNPLNPVNHHNPGDPVKPHNPLNPVNHHNPEDPVKPHNPLNPVNHHNPGDPVKPHNPLNPANHHKPRKPPNPRGPLNLLNAVEPVNPADLSSKPRSRLPSRRLPPAPRGQQYLQYPPLKPEPQTEPDAEKGPPEPDLHELLELQLHIQHLQPEPPLSQGALCVAPSSPPQGPAKSPRSPCHLSLPPPPPHHAEARAHRVPSASPPISPSDHCRPLEEDGCAGSAPEIGVGPDRSPCTCADRFTEPGMGWGDPPSSLSPPALHFRAPATRRRYRDSPRWPIPEIHITSLTPFQL